jgi:hypothetical protein
MGMPMGSTPQPDERARRVAMLRAAYDAAAAQASATRSHALLAKILTILESAGSPERR